MPSPDTIELELHCPGCDYDLRGSASDRCPECGLLIDRAALAESQIPWSHRAKIGRVRAYWKTVRWVIRGGRPVGAEVARPVSYRDAVLFQRVTVALVFLPLAAMGLWAYIASLPDERGGSSLGWALEYTGVGVIAVCLWFFLMTATGAAGYFFHPSMLSITRQNRAIALSHYACAPLSVMPISIGLIAAWLWMDQTGWWRHSTGFREDVLAKVLGIALLTAQLVGWWLCNLRLLYWATRCGASRIVALAAYLPLSWIFLGVIFLTILPLAYFALAAMVLSAS